MSNLLDRHLTPPEPEERNVQILRKHVRTLHASLHYQLELETELTEQLEVAEARIAHLDLQLREKSDQLHDTHQRYIATALALQNAISEIARLRREAAGTPVEG